MKPLTAREVERYLKAAGYVYDHAEGSHFVWKNRATGHAVPVPHHGNKPLKQGTLNGIFGACGIEKTKR